ncbi:MAG: GxxExxY protein [Proteobacteria bacterium]|nr:GxxExxY protein [Pseudomonadota bacterium]
MTQENYLTTAHTATTARPVHATNIHPLNPITEKIRDSVFKIHRAFGPGLLESAYENCLFYDLTQNHGLKVERQKIVPIYFEGNKIDDGYRLDLLVEDKVIVEVKAVEKLLPVHEAQLLTYMKLSKIDLGLLINFNEKLVKDGIRRFVL